MALEFICSLLSLALWSLPPWSSGCRAGGCRRPCTAARCVSPSWPRSCRPGGLTPRSGELKQTTQINYLTANDGWWGGVWLLMNLVSCSEKKLIMDQFCYICVRKYQQWGKYNTGIRYRQRAEAGGECNKDPAILIWSHFNYFYQLLLNIFSGYLPLTGETLTNCRSPQGAHVFRYILIYFYTSLISGHAIKQICHGTGAWRRGPSGIFTWRLPLGGESRVRRAHLSSGVKHKSQLAIKGQSKRNIRSNVLCTFQVLTEYLEVVGDGDGAAECGHGAGVGPLVPAPEVLHPEVVSAPEAVPGVGADHHGPGGDHLLPVLPDHHQLAEVLHCARQRHLVTQRRAQWARLWGDDGLARVLDCPELVRGQLVTCHEGDVTDCQYCHQGHELHHRRHCVLFSQLTILINHEIMEIRTVKMSLFFKCSECTSLRPCLVGKP